MTNIVKIINSLFINIIIFILSIILSIFVLLHFVFNYIEKRQDSETLYIFFRIINIFSEIIPFIIFYLGYDVFYSTKIVKMYNSDDKEVKELATSILINNNFVLKIIHKLLEDDDEKDLNIDFLLEYNEDVIKNLSFKERYKKLREFLDDDNYFGLSILFLLITIANLTIINTEI